MGDTWEPGQPIHVETRRLILATLKPDDVHDDDVARWTGEGARSENVWKPPIPMGDYMRGLSGACDQKLRFALKIVHKQSGLIIGYLKAIIDPGDRSMIATTIVGDERFTGGYFGSEATRGMQLFMFENCNVQSLRPRVYTRNEGTRRVLSRFGYVEQSRYEEKAPDGSVAEVCVFHMSKEDWMGKREEGDALVAASADLEI